MDNKIRLNDRRCTAITRTKRRTLVAIILMTICRILGDFSFLQSMILRLINAGNCSEHHDV
jgi:hypothetical protein